MFSFFVCHLLLPFYVYELISFAEVIPGQIMTSFPRASGLSPSKKNPSEQ